MITMLLGFSLIFISSWANVESNKLVIAHRGASGYVVEHTLEAKTAAAVMGADFLEQDLYLTRDDRTVVFHDSYLDSSTDVRRKFPGRARKNGRNYVIDFDLNELRQLRLLEKFKILGHEISEIRRYFVAEPVQSLYTHYNAAKIRVYADQTSSDFGPGTSSVRPNNDPSDPVYPARFPANTGNFRIHTLEEELDLIQGLEKTLDRSIGIITELKASSFHRTNGKCLWCAVRPILLRYGYLDRAIEKILLASFEVDVLEEIHEEYLALKLIQLLSQYTQGGMKRIAKYAYGIGPQYSLLVNVDSKSDKGNGPKLLPTNLVAEARKNGLKIHAWTFIKEGMPAYAKDFDDFLNIFLNEIEIDGVITDFPDLAVEFLRKNKTKGSNGATVNKNYNITTTEQSNGATLNKNYTRTTTEQSNGASICSLSGLFMLAKIMVGQLLLTE